MEEADDRDLNRRAAKATILGFPVGVFSAIVTLLALLLAIYTYYNPLTTSASQNDRPKSSEAQIKPAADDRGRSKDGGTPNSSAQPAVGTAPYHYQQGLSLLKQRLPAAAKRELGLALDANPSDYPAARDFVLACEAVLGQDEAAGVAPDRANLADFRDGLERLKRLRAHRPSDPELDAFIEEALVKTRRLLREGEKGSG
jgi:hypothetical protein